MSFRYLTPDDTKTIERLLVEVREPGPDKGGKAHLDGCRMPSTVA
jgi:hypothetical protein